MRKAINGAVAAIVATHPYAESGYKTDPTHPFPCNAHDVHVSKIDPQTGNAIEVWGPPVATICCR
jgi:hypothetical protein